MQKTSATTCDVFIVTCEMKHRKKIPMEIVMGVFLDEQLAMEQADTLFREKRKQFLKRVHEISNFKPACLQDQENSWIIAYQPSGSWDMREHIKFHVTPNYIRTDMIGGNPC